ncbi:MAG: MotA/TolQ/ExbB proton channel family protein [Granulosicoccaceae bacterium]
MDRIQHFVEQAGPLFISGGPVMWLLLILALIAVVIIIAKWLQFAYLGINRVDFVLSALVHWRKGNLNSAIKTLGDHQKRPASQVVEAAMSGLMNQQPVATVKEEATRVAKLQIVRLRSWLKPLELIAKVSPVIGLLGTVLGVMIVFRQLEQASDQVSLSLLSGGIWQALLTTVMGLMIAIPTFLVHQWLERRIERSANMMQDSVTQVFTFGPKTTADWRSD